MSLTSVICKVLETIIRDHMMDFLIKHKLINPSQHGFLKARSCLTNLLCFFEEITKWVDEGSPVDVIYLDFQKAFDKVPNQRLIRLGQNSNNVPGKNPVGIFEEKGANNFFYSTFSC